MNTPINVCIIDHAELRVSAKAALARLNHKAAVIITNVSNSVPQIRGRSIDSVFLYGLSKSDIDQKLAESIQYAQCASKNAGYSCEYIEIEELIG